MKKMIKKEVWIILSVLFVIHSCRKDESVFLPPPDYGYTKGIYIVNEGQFPTGSGTVDYLDRNGILYSDLYHLANGGQVLGNLVQSINVIGSKTFIVVNNANKIEVVDTKTFEKRGTIENLSSPRYILDFGEETALVSCMGDNTVKIVNTFDYQVKESIPVNGPEKMMMIYNIVWVLSQGGFSVDSTITLIDVTGDQKLVQQTIQVYPQPSGIQQDKNGNVWVLCSGRNAWHPGGESEGHLICIDPVDFTILKDIVFPSKENHPEELVINGSKDVLYYRYPGGIYKFGIEASEPETGPFIAKVNGFYALAFDDLDDHIYGTDPKDYIQNGWVYRYNALTGVVIDSIESGIIPGEIYIMPVPIF